MQRRTLLKTSLAAAVLLTGAGGIAIAVRGLPWADQRLQASGRAIFAAVARGVLEGTLSREAAVAQRQIDEHLDRVEAAIRQFPPALQAELAQLLALIDAAPGRRWFFTLPTPWGEASAQEVQAALQRLRTSSHAMQRQAYHALRDLTNAAYYSEPGTWAALGYPGPVSL